MKRAALSKSLHGSQFIPSDQSSLPLPDCDDDVQGGSEEIQDEMDLEEDNENEDSSEGQPDLEDYFSQWDIPPRDIVGICRAYASYLAATTGCMRVKKD